MIMDIATEAATAWECDKVVPVESIEEDVFNGLGEAQRVWLEAD